MAQETEDSGADTSHQMTTCHLTRCKIRRAMREVDVDDALHQVTIIYHDLEQKAGRDDKRQMLRTERVTHMTDCDDTVQMLTIPMLASEGHM